MTPIHYSIAAGFVCLAAMGCKSEGTSREAPGLGVSSVPTVATIGNPVAVASAAASARTMAKMVLPPERSALPTRIEWDMAPKLPTEAMLGSDCDPKNSAAWGPILCRTADFWRELCEIRQVREYTRVLCRPPVDTIEQPAYIRVTTSKYAALDVYTFAAPNLLVAVAPNRKDTPYRTVEWSWARGTYESSFHKVYPDKEKWGTIFSDGPRRDDSSFQPGRTATEIRLCACQKEVENIAQCNEGAGYSSDDCLTTYGSDCASLLACAAGDPFHAPVCPRGMTNYGPAFRCYPACDEFGACAPGLRCNTSGPIKVCETTSTRRTDDSRPEGEPKREIIKGLPADAIDFPAELPEALPTSKPPTANEWKTGQRYGIDGILPCDITTVREWLRLSCRDLAEESAFAVKKESGLQLYTTRQNENGSNALVIVGFVTQMGRNKSLEAELRMKQGRHVISLQWPEGQKQAQLRITTVEIGLENPKTELGTPGTTGNQGP